MGETCLHVPARVFGFESTVETAGQLQTRSPGQPEQRSSLLSTLLRGSCQPPPSTFMDTPYDDPERSQDAEDEDMGDDDEDLSAAGGSAPMPIPLASEAFLKAQREALKRFGYAHQIEEMRKQCAEYFSRQTRFNEVLNADSTNKDVPPAPSAPADAFGKRLAAPQQASRHRKPGF